MQQLEELPQHEVRARRDVGTCVVTSVSDDAGDGGDGTTLRQCLAQVVDGDEVRFKLPTTGRNCNITILLDAPLPSIAGTLPPF